MLLPTPHVAGPGDHSSRASSRQGLCLLFSSSCQVTQTQYCSEYYLFPKPGERRNHLPNLSGRQRVPREWAHHLYNSGAVARRSGLRPPAGGRQLAHHDCQGRLDLPGQCSCCPGIPWPAGHWCGSKQVWRPRVGSPCLEPLLTLCRRCAQVPLPLASGSRLNHLSTLSSPALVLPVGCP